MQNGNYAVSRERQSTLLTHTAVVWASAGHEAAMTGSPVYLQQQEEQQPCYPNNSSGTVIPEYKENMQMASEEISFMEEKVEKMPNFSSLKAFKAVYLRDAKWWNNTQNVKKS